MKNNIYKLKKTILFLTLLLIITLIVNYIDNPCKETKNLSSSKSISLALEVDLNLIVAMKLLMLVYNSMIKS